MTEKTKSHQVYSLLIILIVEKIIQHVTVTLALYFNWADIVSTVVISPTVLMILGAIIAVLFMIALFGIIKQQVWATNLVIALALFDIIGEFVAQGKLAIVITLSFIVAVFLLILALMYRSQRELDNLE